MANRILRPLDLGGLLDETFDLYKKNFVLFLGISGIVLIPASIIENLFSTTTYKNGQHAFLILPLTYLVTAATAKAVSERYLERTATIVGSYQSVMRRIFPFIMTMLLATIIIWVGVLLLIVPGIIFAVWYAFIPSVFVLEGKTWASGRNRSKELAKGEANRILTIGIVTGLISIVVSFAISALARMLTGVDFGGLTMGSRGLSGLVTGIASTLTTPISVIAFVLLYYDVRIRKEGFDIEMLAQSMDTPVAASPAPEPPTAPEEQTGPKDENG